MHGVLHESTNNDTIFQACSQEGIARYGQCTGTPFMQSPLSDNFGYLGNQQAIDAVLDGSYQCPANTLEYVKKFIAELKRPNVTNLPTVTGTATAKEHTQGWKHMKVHTCRGSRCRHCLHRCCYWIQPATMVNCNICDHTKAKLSRDVTKLRIIVLFHALFSMMNKRVAKKAIRNAENINKIPSEAYAKRGHRTIDCALNKILTLDIIRQWKVPAALCCNDAKQCYDHILHANSNIYLQRVGGCPKTCFVRLGTLQQMQHHIKTAYRISKDSYGCVQIPLQGVLQGNGAGPAIWMLISIPLINMLRTQGFGFKSTNILSGEEYQFACYTYVDDTDLIHIGDSNTSPQNVFDGMQNMLNHWEGGLRATGGALVPKKS
jgi:hypothetical protein